MQTPKGRIGSSEVPQKTSPATPRTVHQGKTPGADSDSVSAHSASRTPNKRSPKITERKSPRSPALEKKRPGRVSELESQLAQLQDDLKKIKEQLTTSESWKRRAQQEAEEAKNEAKAMAAKLEESQQQLAEISASEDDRVQQLRKISHDRDLAWQSELEAVHKQHEMDTAALSSALNEMQKLKIQLERVAGSEAAQTKQADLAYAEIDKMRQELAETLSLVDTFKAELNVCKESEARALEIVSETQAQLETAKRTEDEILSDGLKIREAYDSKCMELEQSKAQVASLEEIASKLQADLANCGIPISGDASSVATYENGVGEELNQLKAELELARNETNQLKSALDAAEVRYQEEYIQSTLQIRSAYELVEHAKSEACLRERELKAEINKVKADVEELKAKLMEKATELQGVLDENEGLSLKIERDLTNNRESVLEAELKKLEAGLADMKSCLMDKEMNLQNIIEENEMLKLEVEKMNVEQNAMKDEASTVAEAAKAAKAAEQEASEKLSYLTEETDKHSRRAARVAEQLDSAQAANSDLEAELRRLKVQSDQWRKAAEAAATILSPGSNGKLVERTGSLDSSYQTIAGKMSSPYSDDTDDDSPKKKNGNMLKKIGVLWKKGQK